MIICGSCGDRHHQAATVQLCHHGLVFACPWLVQRGWDEDGQQVIAECGAAAWEHPRGFACEAGHEHIDAQTRAAEGWEYAEDAGEAANLVKAGVQPYDMQGRIWMEG